MDGIQKRLKELVRSEGRSIYNCLCLSDADSAVLAKEFFEMLTLQGKLEKGIQGFPAMDCVTSFEDFIEDIRCGIRGDLTFRGVSLCWFCGDTESFLLIPTLKTLLNC